MATTKRNSPSRSHRGGSDSERPRDEQGRFIDETPGSPSERSSGRGEGSRGHGVGQSERPRDEQGRFIDEDDRDRSKGRGGSDLGGMR